MLKINKPIEVIVVGYGFRGEAYSDYAVEHGDSFHIKGVVDPNDLHRNKCKEKFSIPDEFCFSSFEEFVKKGKIADCIINATMDDLHVKTALPLLNLGYDMLLEKPLTNNVKDLLMLEKTAEKNGCKLIVCHVLRYTPFYKKIKELVNSGAIGRLRHVETSENVAIPHASASYIRGKWNNSKKCGSSYLLAKCCHDLDIICWLNNKTQPSIISSIGGRNYFIPSSAPKNAGTRCLLDCPVEKECQYSIGKMYGDNNPFSNYIWENYQDKNFTEAEKIENLKYENPHGRCIFKTDSDLVDQQITVIKFADGSTAEHTLFSGAPAACRRIHIYGDKGEIIGILDTSELQLLRYSPEKLNMSAEKIDIDLSIVDKGHAGGDYCIMEDLYNTLTGGERSISCTDIKDSINGHLCVFAADKSLETGKTIDFNEFME